MVTRTEEHQPGKTFWDLLQLLILPGVASLGVAWYKRVQEERDQRLANERMQQEREIAQDNQREAALQAYLDAMSELLLKEQLRSSAANAEVRKIARVRTLTILPRLDGVRKGSVLQFLYESGLIVNPSIESIIEMKGADLREVQVHYTLTGEWQGDDYVGFGAQLCNVNLRGTDLSKANLFCADLKGADLSGAIVIEANLKSADLTEADLRGANLADVDFTDAEFRQVNLAGSNLVGATFTEEQWIQAKSTEDTERSRRWSRKRSQFKANSA